MTSPSRAPRRRTTPRRLGVALAALLIATVLAPATQAQGDQPSPRAATKSLDLTHAVKDNFPDPGFLVDRSSGSPRYYLYATGGNFRSRSATSPRGPFTSSGSILAARDAKTSWEKKTGHHWAPHVFAAGGRYVLWYTGTPRDGVTTTSSGAKRYHDCIGVATAATPVPVSGQPATKFQPAGAPLICSSKKQTLIDPSHYEQGGRHFLVYKRRTYATSVYEILAVEVTADGLALAPGAKPKRLLRSSSNIEAPSLVKRGKTLWLFTSRRDYRTCQYRTEVFRSTRLSGGWKSVGVMKLQPRISSSKFCGPGGAEVVNDNGTYRIAFHAYDNSATRKNRTVWTGPLSWSSGRPKVRTR